MTEWQPISTADGKLTAVEALAQSWASIDGKLEPFLFERDNNISVFDPRCTGHYEGYMAEAETMIVRLKTRGYEIVAIEPPSTPSANQERGGAR
jgi:hypothetical protein